VLGGTQSLHTNSFDEAIALPTQKAARLALRTQQVIAYETDVCKTVDPFAGSYVIESLTDELEAKIWELIQAVEDKGGAVAAIEQGFQKQEIERLGLRRTQLETDSGERIVVGPQQVHASTPRRSTSRCASTRPSRPSSAHGWRSSAQGPRQRRRGRRRSRG
jgi:methylmalonyl-CoA mutase cobalamin-binding domain/chain